MQNPDMLTELLIIILVITALIIIYYYTRMSRKPKGDKESYISALEYMADGSEKRAIQQLKEAVREDSENVDAYLRLGDLLRKKGLMNNALKIHKDLMLRSNLSEDQKNKIQYSLLLDYELMGNYSSSIELARTILSKNTVFQNEVVLKLLTYLEKEEKWQEAATIARKYFRELPAQLKKRIALYLVFEGLKIQEKGEGRDARIKIKEGLKIDPECDAAYYYLGKSYYSEHRLEDAIREWKNLCITIPQNAHVAFESLERTWFEIGRFNEAEKLYRNILDKDPENIHAALALARIYSKKEDFDSALDILDRLGEKSFLEPRIVGYRIQLLSNKNQYKQASALAVDFFHGNFDLSDRAITCQECQYKSTEPQWICPQCKSIASFED